MTSSKIPDTMLAAQVVEFNKPYKVQHARVPSDLAPHDLLIKVAIASLCHTDFMVLEGSMGTKLPCSGSHEGSGTVVAVGSSVKGFKPGDRVMSGILYHGCGECGDCKGPENYSQYCAHSGGYCGVTTDGFFAEYARIDAKFAAKLPDRVSFETAAPMACAGCTVWRGILQTELKEGQWVALVGSGGGLGHLGVQFAKARGLKVVGIDARDEGLGLTKKGGADVVIDARIGHEKVVEEVKKATNGELVAATVNISHADRAMATACAVTRMHGLVVQIALLNEVVIPFRELIFRDIRVRGSLICSPEEARQMLDVVDKHRISVNTNAFNGLDKIAELMELAEGGKMKGKGIIIVDPEQIKKEKESGLKMV
ncbi:chaperonin 10-like protein [Clohesyomyces aquaticus]|uniref:Chaperonin 10-like protein n=1 Tax=Clohesyomyces aquaticus TaxID=1231657 RepID=A0A1Y1ZGB6_9PLEO|nr:chaperonin 10-like protein [Clohesyomyces aquaticus]